MSELVWILIGVFTTLVVVCVTYILQVWIKITINRNKIKNTLVQITGQVDLKHNLLKEYIKLNKESIVKETFIKITNTLNEYEKNLFKDVDCLKDYNSYYVDYMKTFDDSLLHKQCDESEEKINYIKEYYNELVCSYNNYKSIGINSFVSKALSIDDAKLY
jgi:hypothetical protein